MKKPHGNFILQLIPKMPTYTHLKGIQMESPSNREQCLISYPGYQMKIPVPGESNLYSRCWSMGSNRCPQQYSLKPLLLINMHNSIVRSYCSSVIGHGETKLELTQIEVLALLARFHNSRGFYACYLGRKVINDPTQL